MVCRYSTGAVITVSSAILRISDDMLQRRARPQELRFLSRLTANFDLFAAIGAVAQDIRRESIAIIETVLQWRYALAALPTTSVDVAGLRCVQLVDGTQAPAAFAPFLWQPPGSDGYVPYIQKMLQDLEFLGGYTDTVSGHGDALTGVPWYSFACTPCRPTCSARPNEKRHPRFEHC